MTNKDLRILLKKERQLRHVVDTIREFVQNYHEGRDKNQLEARITKLDEVYDSFCSTRAEIEMLLEDIDADDEYQEVDETVEAHDQRRDKENEITLKNFINEYFILKQSLQAFQSTAGSSSSTGSTTTSNQPFAAAAVRVKLPEMKLPTFNGNLHDWLPFRDTFRNLIIDNSQLSDIDKFTYLRTSLTAEAFQEIGSIELTAANFSIAWKSLESRYENKKLLVKSHLDAIFAINPMKKESFESLNYVVSEFDKHLQMLDKLGENTTNWSTILVYMLTSKLDPSTLRMWETEHRSRDVPVFKKLLDFLKNHSIILQSLGTRRIQTTESKKPMRTVNSYTGVQAGCPFCGDTQHRPFQCKKLTTMKVEERRNVVKGNQLCFNCLSRGHMSRTCTRGSCRICGQRHHTLLHLAANQGSPTQSAQSTRRTHLNSRIPQTTQTFPTQNQIQDTRTPQNSTNQSISNSLPIVFQSTNRQTPPPIDTPVSHNVALFANEAKTSRSVLLATAVVVLEDQFGNTTLARALLDSGSQMCFMSENLSQKLKFKRSREIISVSGIGQSTKRCKQSVVARLKSRVSHFSAQEVFYVLPQVTVNLPTSKIHISNIPQAIDLADPHFHEPGSVDLIIGAGLFFELLRDEKIKLEGNNLTIQKTELGWIVCGRMPEEQIRFRSIIANHSSERIDDLLTRFWELESCRSNSIHSVEESICEATFDRTTIRDPSGRFIVTLPKKDFLIKQLGDSNSIALKRFLALEKRLAANPEIKNMYTNFLEEYYRLGHMREVETDDHNCQQYVIPHHCVIKPGSTTTKLRVVFDASCPSSTGVSLNDALMVGPTLQDDLIALVLRFRFHRYALIADIEKMYRMIQVQPNDRQLQRIFWRRHQNEPIRVFELCTVTYGTASAPYLATKCLKRLAELDGAKFPNAARILANDFYVDDLISGVDTVDEGSRLVSEMTQLLEGGGFTLRKWSSNSATILDQIPTDLKDNRSSVELDSASAIVKTLGLAWEPRLDYFTFKVPCWNRSEICKRTILSDLARIFDPMGLISPIVIIAKLFVQTLWKQKVSWDEPLSNDLQSQWQGYRQSLAGLEDMKIPRWVAFSRDCLSVEFHGFCDASTKAYGACVYVRCTHFNGAITSHLLVAKSKVAPLDDQKRKKKTQTIPRLELSSALLLAHLYETVAKSIKVSARPSFWTDSMVVRYWLSSIPSRWQVFVAHRVSEIQHLTRDGGWNHVPSAENPADLVSRGVAVEQLKGNQLWWHGPPWVCQQKENWPQTTEVISAHLDYSLLEEKSTVAVVTHVLPTSEIFTLKSSLNSLTRLVAWLLRFKHNSVQVDPNHRRAGFLTFLEIENALSRLVELAQRECFATELEDLKRRGQVKVSSRINSLHPRLVDGILRVGGRLENASISTNRKHPIILDKNHPLTTLIVLHYHHQLLHAGQSLLIASVRERYWPLSVRNIARKIIHRCVTCFRVKPIIHEQLMADFPRVRVTPAPPFCHVGVDYCGPFLINYPLRKRVTIKYFAAIFVCLVTRAVHIEMVADLTTAAFIAALKRFVARRGKPTVIMCDNATNFVGARRQLDELRRLFVSQQTQQSLACASSDLGIDFRFIPARSPNFGGLWEAAVKSMKQHLKRTIGLNIVTPDELQTVLVQIEACLNSRPLTPISSDPSDLEVLTPGHFLVQRPLTAIPEPRALDVQENHLSRWRRAQEFVHRIWSKWSTEYLSNLQNRTKWTRRRTNLSVGMMVLIKEDHLPPLKWQLGRITQVHPGADGNIRVVTVRTKDSTFTRAISKICILPIDDNEPAETSKK